MKSKSEQKIEKTADRAIELLQRNRLTAFLRLITPKLVVITTGFAMVVASVVGIVAMTLWRIGTLFSSGEWMFFTLSLVVFGVEGMAIAAGTQWLLGGD